MMIVPLFAIQVKTGIQYTGWPESDSTLNGMIEITADSLATSDRLPVQVIYLVDISRECAGIVRQRLIEGGKEIINALRENDRFGIVVYSQFARTLLPLTNITPESRAEAIELLERITTEEGRDLSVALKRVASEFKVRAGEKIDGRFLVISSLAAITDGKKKSGLIPELNLSESTDSIGCVIHTVNYGETFDEQNAIRGAELSGGRAYFAPKDQPDSLTVIFKEISASVTSPLYRNIELYIEFPEGGIRLQKFGTTEPLSTPIKIKQIARGKTERILFTLTNRPEQSSVIQFDVDYYDIGTMIRQNQKAESKISGTKEEIYNPDVAASIIRASILQHLAENILLLRRADSEMDPKMAKEFRRNYAFAFQQQVVNRLETLKSTIGTNEMDRTIQLMQRLFEEIRDGVYSNEYLIRKVKFELHQTLHGR